MNDELVFGLLIVSLVVSIISLVVSRLVYSKLKKFTLGKSGSSLEEVIHDSIHQCHEISKQNFQIKKNQSIIKELLTTSTATPAIIRFNPFRDSGSNQSFALAILDRQGDGFVMSSLFAQGKTNIFAKPIKKFSSDYELTQEEEKVLQQVKNEVL